MTPKGKAGFWLAIVALSSPASADVVSLNIDWAAAGDDFRRNQALEATEVKAVRAAAVDVDKVAVPVLALKSGGPSRGGPAFVEQTTSYAITYPLERAKLSIFGSGVGLQLDEKSSTGLIFNDPKEGNMNFDTSEDGADLSFSRFGASYILRLLCNDVEDTRCTKEDFLYDIAEQLMVVGGAKLKGVYPLDTSRLNAYIGHYWRSQWPSVNATAPRKPDSGLAMSKPFRFASSSLASRMMTLALSTLWTNATGSRASARTAG